ncbi:ABC transporter permease [Tessaracoccus oleiagri]|uniref:Transport permease protein n=1 Tax=Tessaracoccus oleiagri TaxID=686624 RepID=A0A1G9HEX7_9ACTN|nr:ABC transporter permease [Tessaracoccus oleiagri]SDL11467.1 ABC-2 type transport system permease protein [Tessaracoccus oleiagri]
MSVIKELWQERKVLSLLVKRDLRVRYSQSFLGYLWTVIDPLANALIYFMIFVVIFQRSDAGHHPYFLFLLAGLLPWQWFNSAVSESMRALVTERQLVRSTKLPREIWVVRVVASKGLEFLYSLPVLALFVAVYLVTGDATLDWELVFFPVAAVMQFLLITGLGLILAPLTVMMFDIQPTVRIFLRIYFYMTPIIFNLELLEGTPDGLRWIFQINPLTGILELYRGGMFDADIRWHVVGYAAVGVALIVGLGVYVFKRLERSVLKEI